MTYNDMEKANEYFENEQAKANMRDYLDAIPKPITYCLGKFTKNPQVNDWQPINAKDDAARIGDTWNDYSFSPSTKVFRQEGGNSNGDEWERYYVAQETKEKLIFPRHVVNP